MRSRNWLIQSRAMTTDRAPRRLTREARYQQLVELAMPIVAEHGFGDFSLEEIARRADVTRNNLYRYFPRGRPDIVAAVVREAGRELLSGWVTDPELSLEERLRANSAHVAEHAFGPSDAWRIHRRARAADQPEINRIVADHLELIVANVSLNHVGTADPPPRVRVAIEGMIAFSETLVDRARGTDISQEEIVRIIIRTLVAALDAAR
jgi:AcrR family transcriptional regulator